MADVSKVVVVRRGEMVRRSDGELLRLMAEQRADRAEDARRLRSVTGRVAPSVTRTVDVAWTRTTRTEARYAVAGLLGYNLANYGV